jgi:hypothetical protein
LLADEGHLGFSGCCNVEIVVTATCESLVEPMMCVFVSNVEPGEASLGRFREVDLFMFTAVHGLGTVEERIT